MRYLSQLLGNYNIQIKLHHLDQQSVSVCLFLVKYNIYQGGEQRASMYLKHFITFKFLNFETPPIIILLVCRHFNSKVRSRVWIKRPTIISTNSNIYYNNKPKHHIINLLSP